MGQAWLLAGSWPDLSTSDALRLPEAAAQPEQGSAGTGQGQTSVTPAQLFRACLQGACCFTEGEKSRRQEPRTLGSWFSKQGSRLQFPLGTLLITRRQEAPFPPPLLLQAPGPTPGALGRTMAAWVQALP